MRELRRQDGGSAFPQPGVRFEDAVPVARSFDCPGMSLRDWFAGQALAGLLAAGDGDDTADAGRMAYDFADAMLVAREEKP